MSGPETVLVNKIRKAILTAYPDESWVFKVVGSPQQETGIPDLLVCVRGHLLGLEVKARRPGESALAARGRATPIQLAQLDRLLRAGATVAVVLSEAEALDAIALALLPSKK
jgi:hypothetical protein